MVLILILTTLFLFPFAVFANFTLVLASPSGGWIQTCRRGTNKDGAESLIRCNYGGYIIAGQHKRFFYSSTKLILALENRCFWKNGLEQNLRFDWVSDRTLCIQTSDGGYAFVVMVNGVAEVVKINSVGNIQWDRTFAEATFAYSIIQSSDDGYVLAGSTGGSGPSLGDNF